METFNIHLVQPNDKDYPTLMMKLVPHAEHYQLISMDGLILVPLNQVFDALSEIKADLIIRNGVECCPKCFKPLGETGNHKGEWIPVSERLPESGKEVLFCDIDDDIRLGYHLDDCPRTHFTEYGSWERMKNVVAWQPLPEPYKKGDKAE